VTVVPTWFVAVDAGMTPSELAAWIAKVEAATAQE
jgi:hypothetical protein